MISDGAVFDAILTAPLFESGRRGERRDKTWEVFRSEGKQQWQRRCDL